MPADRLLHPRLGHSEKVTQLSDLEFRVWLTYVLASDDYGVMRESAVTIQAANDALANRKPAQISDALRRFVAIGLLHSFEHQGRRYVYQETWQNFQRVKYPRDTMQPAPPAEELVANCTPATQKLFRNFHPAFRNDSDNSSETSGKDFRNISETLPKDISENGCLARAGGRETANGRRLMANEGGEGEEFRFDASFELLKNIYPPNRVTSGHRTMTAFVDALEKAPETDKRQAFGRMLSNLGNQKKGHEWRVKGMIPGLEKWLRDGLWEQQHDETPPVAEQVSPRTLRMLEGR